ncbi:MAG: PqiC family protein [Gammaproteobacteria bacterium]
MKLSKPVMRTLLIFSLLGQTACIGSTPPSEFYLLEPLTESQISAPHPADEKPILALQSVRVPHYLDRPQIITASGDNTYQLDELNRWAESLDDNITRVMLQDLNALAPVTVVSANGPRNKQAQFRLAVTILEFHIDPQGQALLTAQWQIGQGDDVVLSRQSAYKIPTASDEMSSKVQALNQCLHQLSREIATAAAAL